MTFYLFFNCRIIALQYLIGFCHTSTWIIHVVVVIVIQSISTFSLFVTHRVQHARFPCPLLCPRVCSNSWILSPWCYSTISSFVDPFSSYLQSFPASGSFPMSRFFASGGQSTGVSTSSSVLPMNIQDRVPLGLTGLIFLLSMGLSRALSSSTVQKHQIFTVQFSLW